MDRAMKRILVVDDEEDIRNLMASVIEAENLDCVTAGDGKTGLEMLQSQEFDSVLCDINMPNFSGLDLLAASKAADIRVPFVFLTGYGDEKKILQALRLGVVDFLEKPSAMQKIMDVLFRSMEIGRRERDMRTKIEDTNSELRDQINYDSRVVSLLRVKNSKGN